MLVGMAWDGMGWGGMRWETMTWHAGELPGKLRGEAEEAGESGACRRGGQEADFSSQAATRKASDDGQKAQPAANHPQTSLTNAGDRRDEERRGENPTQSSHYTRNRAPRPAFLQGRSSEVRNFACEEALRTRIGKQRGHIE